MKIKKVLMEKGQLLAEKLLTSKEPNDLGNRDVEWSWVATHIPFSSRLSISRPKALDFGAGTSWLGLIAARRGYDTRAFDMREVKHLFRYPGYRTMIGDILQMSIQDMQGPYTLIINCSSVEHVGLKRYGAKIVATDGDLRAMYLLRSILLPDGMMLLTVPVGQDLVAGTTHRIYGVERLPLLLEGWKLEDEEYWAKLRNNQWEKVSKIYAMKLEAGENSYGLGMFILRKTGQF